jgi:hypothetical protein
MKRSEDFISASTRNYPVDKALAHECKLALTVVDEQQQQL